MNTCARIVHYLDFNLNNYIGCICSRFLDSTTLEGVIFKSNRGGSVERPLGNLKTEATETLQSVMRSAK